MQSPPPPTRWLNLDGMKEGKHDAERYEKADLDSALAELQRGGLILCPTDTIWGISCDATQGEAVQKVFDLKQRADSKSLIVLLDHENKIERYVRTVPQIAWDLMAVSDKPLTIVYEGGQNLAAGVMAADGTVAIRLVSDPFCIQLIRKLGRPIVSTSANISSRSFNGLFSGIDKPILEKVDYVVNYRRADQRPARPSSVIRLDSAGRVAVLRP